MGTHSFFLDSLFAFLLDCHSSPLLLLSLLLQFSLALLKLFLVEGLGSLLPRQPTVLSQGCGLQTPPKIENQTDQIRNFTVIIISVHFSVGVDVMQSD